MSEAVKVLGVVVLIVFTIIGLLSVFESYAVAFGARRMNFKVRGRRWYE